MATAVFLHAHPDDESISTGGTMLLAAAAGHRVVLVCATDGGRGEAPGIEPGHWSPELAAMREAEVRAAGRILGAQRVEMLGYADSGMVGDPGNLDPDCFWQADVSEAGARLAEILRDERADLLTCYDGQGTYGHPDHIQVHRVGVNAAELAGVNLVFEATIDRDHLQQMMKQWTESEPASASPDGDSASARVDAGEASKGEDADSLNEAIRSTLTDSEIAEFEEGKFGVEAARITHRIDVRAVAEQKREAMRSHSSQIPPDSFFLTLPAEAFEWAFGTEWYIQRDRVPNGTMATDLFASLQEP